jgi:hypothetical protein
LTCFIITSTSYFFNKDHPTAATMSTKDKWAFDLVKTLDNYRSRLPDDLSYIESAATKEAMNVLKRICEDIGTAHSKKRKSNADQRSVDELLVNLINQVTLDVFKTKILGVEYTAFLGSDIYETVIWPFLRSIFILLPVWRDPPTFSRELLEVMMVESQSTFEEIPMHSDLVMPDPMTCACCNKLSRHGSMFKVKQSAITSAYDWWFDGECGKKIMSIVAIYHMFRCLTTGAAPFECLGDKDQYTQADEKYQELLRLFTLAVKLSEKS